MNVIDSIRLLEDFNCPVLFVLGNSDPELIRRTNHWPSFAEPLHQRLVTISGFTFSGLDGIFDVSESRSKDNDYPMKTARRLLSEAVKKDIDPRRLIITTHERLPKIHDACGDCTPLAYMFGHIHSPACTEWKETTNINTSILDGNRSAWGAGNYWVIEAWRGRLRATPKPLNQPNEFRLNNFLECIELVGQSHRHKQQLTIFRQLYPDIEIPF